MYGRKTTLTFQAPIPTGLSVLRLKLKLGINILVKQEAVREHEPLPRLVWGTQNSLVKRETVYPITSRVHIPKISWISIYLYFNNVGNKHRPRK